MAPDTEPHFCYRLDAADVVEWVDDAWLAFAQANGTTLTRASVIGKSVWKFVQGSELRQLYRLVFASVRSQNRPATIPFRCDSPAERRHMKLVISSLEGDNLELCGHLEVEEHRSHIDLLDVNVPRADTTVTVCSICRRFQMDDTSWVEAEVAMRSLKSSPIIRPPTLIQRVCPECRNTVLEAATTGSAASG